MATLADRIRSTERFASIDYLTLRDDAPKPIRDQATAQLRDVVLKYSRATTCPDRPLTDLVRGLTKVCASGWKDCRMPFLMRPLMPDDRLVTWVLAMAEQR